jgi:thiamine-monophosphate kinase
MAEADRRGEDDLIARHFAPLSQNFPGALGLRDDAAIVTPPDGSDLVVTTDTLIAGVHFLAHDAPADIAFKSLAVNVSDLAAKAARPLAYSLALALSAGWREAWLAGFAEGLREAQAEFGIDLCGGDTTVSSDGPLMVSITAFGTTARGGMVRRGGARPGDALYISGTIGDAALGLRLRRDDADALGWPLDDAGRAYLIRRYLRPAPRLALREALLAHASAAMDISDGLVIDCARLCAASGADARIEARLIPLSPAARTIVAADPGAFECALTGGDDYEILAAIRPGAEPAFEAGALAAGIPVACIGAVGTGAGTLSVIGPDGLPMIFARPGYDHLTIDASRAG